MERQSSRRKWKSLTQFFKDRYLRCVVAARSAEPNGVTSPEELIAAAHSTCFAMAFAHGLAQAGTPATQLRTSADVDFTPGTGITEIRLRVSGDVPGLSPEAFKVAAENAKENCPVSKALQAVPIKLIVE